MRNNNLLYFFNVIQDFLANEEYVLYINSVEINIILNKEKSWKTFVNN